MVARYVMVRKGEITLEQYLKDWDTTQQIAEAFGNFTAIIKRG